MLFKGFGLYLSFIHLNKRSRCDQFIQRQVFKNQKNILISLTIFKGSFSRPVIFIKTYNQQFFLLFSYEFSYFKYQVAQIIYTISSKLVFKQRMFDKQSNGKKQLKFLLFSNQKQQLQYFDHINLSGMPQSQIMSKLILNHNKNNIVFINDYGIGQFQLQSTQQKVDIETPILFKVITNIKQNITLTPSNGVLMSQGAKSKRLIQVKFSGADSDMKKAKIQIRWLALNSNSQLFPQLQSVLIFTDFYRKCSDKYKEQRIQMTLQSSNEHNIQVVQHNLKVAKESKVFKQYEPLSQSPSTFMKNEEGDVFYYVYLQSKGLSQETIKILKKNNIKSLKQLKKIPMKKLGQTQIPLVDLIKLQQIVSK